MMLLPLSNDICVYETCLCVYVGGRGGVCVCMIEIAGKREREDEREREREREQVSEDENLYAIINLPE